MDGGVTEQVCNALCLPVLDLSRRRGCVSKKTSMSVYMCWYLEGGGVAGHVCKQSRELLQGRAGRMAGSGHEREEAVQQAWRLPQQRQVGRGLGSHPQQPDGRGLKAGLVQHCSHLHAANLLSSQPQLPDL